MNDKNNGKKKIGEISVSIRKCDVGIKVRIV
jgi:hypothetical protein